MLGHRSARTPSLRDSIIGVPLKLLTVLLPDLVMWIIQDCRVPEERNPVRYNPQKNYSFLYVWGPRRGAGSARASAALLPVHCSERGDLQMLRIFVYAIGRFDFWSFFFVCKNDKTITFQLRGCKSEAQLCEHRDQYWRTLKLILGWKIQHGSIASSVFFSGSARRSVFVQYMVQPAISFRLKAGRVHFYRCR